MPDRIRQLAPFGYLIGVAIGTLILVLTGHHTWPGFRVGIVLTVAAAVLIERRTRKAAADA